MKIQKNTIFLFLISIAILIICYFSYNYYKKLKQPTIDVISAIPDDAILFAEFNNIYNLWNTHHSSNDIWKGLRNILFFENTNTDLTYINTIIEMNTKVKQVLSNQNSSLSYHFINRDTLAMLFVINIPTTFEDKEIANLLNDASISQTEEGKFKNIMINSIKSNNSSYYYSITHGVFIGSSFKKMIEKSITQITEGISITTDQHFLNINSTAGKKVEANIFINYQQMGKLFNFITKNNFTTSYNLMTNFAKWTEFDALIKKNQILLNGYSSTSSTFLDIFKEILPQEFYTDKVLPYNTSFFINYNILNFTDYHSKYKTYLKNLGKLIQYEKELNNLNLKVKFNLRDNFAKWMGSSFTSATINSENYSTDDNYVICQTTNSETADSCLKAIAIASQTDNQKTIIINQNKISLPGFLNVLIGDFISPTTVTWFEVTDNFIIFGSSENSLQKYKSAIEEGNVLANNKDYLAFNTSVSNKSNIYAYLNMDYIRNLSKYLLNNDNQNNNDKIWNTLQGFHKISFQVSNSDNRFFTNLNIEYKAIDSSLTNIPADTQITAVESSTKISNIIVKQPFIFTNKTENKKYLLIFDASNKLYCIDNKNFNVKWSAQTDGKILSKFIEIDFYKNNKIQFLFNTEKSIYLIDVNGNFIENFPVKLQKKATTGISLADFDNKKNYTVIVPTSEKEFQYFKLKNETKKEFTSIYTNRIQANTIQQIVFGGKDNIIVSDLSGNFSILNNKGKERFNIKTPFKKNPNSKFYSDGKYLLTSDKGNNIKYISTKGEIITRHFNTISDVASFYYDDFNNDNKKDYIFLTDNELFICTKEAKIQYKYTFASKINQELYILEKSPMGKLFIVKGIGNKIYIFNKKGIIESSLKFNSETFPLLDVEDKKINLYTVTGRNIQTSILE